MIRTVVPIMVLREGHSELARTVGVPLIDVGLTQIFLMISTDQMTFTLISDLAIDYVNLREEVDLCHKRRNGGEGAQVLHILQITENSMREMAGEQIVAPQVRGKDEDLQMRDFPGIQMTRVLEEDGKKALEEGVHLNGMRVGVHPEEGKVFLVLKTLGQRKILMHQMRLQGEEILEAEAEVLHEEDGRVYFPHQMNFLDLKEDGNQTHGMQIESQAMSISGMVHVLIILLMMGILLPAENALPLSKAWIWLLYHPESVPGMMDLEHLTTEKWRLQVDLQRIEAKDEVAQDHPRECQNLDDPVPWTEIIMMDITEMNLMGVLKAVAPLPEEEGVEVTGGEEII